MNSVFRREATPRVCIIVVNYNTRDYLRRCLVSIERHHQVVVVDNASTDGSVEMIREEFAWVELVRNRTNRGFGAANNIGMERANTPFVLFLNSDAYAEPGAIDTLADTLETHPDAVGCGGRLWNTDGTLQPSCANPLSLWAVFCEQTYLEKVFPRSSHFSPYWHNRPLLETTPVAQVMGACLMIRPLQRFDENYFLYCEDTDLCYRLAREGNILYVPDANFVHALGSSTRANPWFAIANYNRGKELFFCLHYGAASGVLCWLLNRLGALLRLLVWGLLALFTLGQSGRIRRQAEIFLRVLLTPAQGPIDTRRPAPWQRNQAVAWTYGTVGQAENHLKVKL